MARVQRKLRGLTFAPVEHSDEELHRRLKYAQQQVGPFFTLSLSEDQKNIICTNVRTGKVRFVESADTLFPVG